VGLFGKSGWQAPAGEAKTQEFLARLTGGRLPRRSCVLIFTLLRSYAKSP
jgi:hypothetical protein